MGESFGQRESVVLFTEGNPGIIWDLQVDLAPHERFCWLFAQETGCHMRSGQAVFMGTHQAVERGDHLREDGRHKQSRRGLAGLDIDSGFELEIDG